MIHGSWHKGCQWKFSFAQFVYFVMPNAKCHPVYDAFHSHLRAT